MKAVFVIILAILIAGAGFYGLKRYQRSQPGAGAGRLQTDQPENKENGIPLTGDPCGGTGGNGQIISKGHNAFTIKRKGGSNLLVNMAQQAGVKTASGPAAFSDLKIGERVTLVGSMNRDRTFTADTVVVCETGQ